MAITQAISAIPSAGHRGVDSQTVFVTKQEAFQDTLTETTVTQLNTAFVQLNNTETNINAKEASATTSANTATTMASAASASANLQGIWTNQTTVVGDSWYYAGSLYRVLVSGNTSPVATPSNWAIIPSGLINDAIIGLLNTWSASKIVSEIATQVSASATSYATTLKFN